MCLFTLSLSGNFIDMFRHLDQQQWRLKSSLVITMFIMAISFRLVGNPICQQSGGEAESYCRISQSNSSSYSTPPNNCIRMVCSIINQTSSPNCKCSFPYTGTLFFRAPTFSNLGNTTYYTTLASSMMTAFQKYQLPVDSVSLSNPHKDSTNYLKMTLQIFPSVEDRFNRTGAYSLGFVLSNQTYKPPSQFGPFYFVGDQYEDFSAQVPQESVKSSSSEKTGVIAGAAAGGFVLLLLLALAGTYALRQKKKAEKVAEMSNILGKRMICAVDTENHSSFLVLDIYEKPGKELKTFVRAKWDLFTFLLVFLEHIRHVELN